MKNRYKRKLTELQFEEQLKKAIKEGTEKEIKDKKRK